jgi:hypothetical protein
MTTASRSLATALPMGALRERLALPSYTTTGDTIFVCSKQQTITWTQVQAGVTLIESAYASFHPFARLFIGILKICPMMDGNDNTKKSIVYQLPCADRVQ